MASTSDQAPQPEAPLEDFSQAHAGILGQLRRLGEVPALIEPAERLRTLAGDLLHFFQDVVLQHHKEEEEELFTAVLASARAGEEHALAKRQIDQLTDEHRDVEAKWKRLRPEIQKLAKGQPAQVDPVVIGNLLQRYEQHARFEESEFLPLASRILGRDDRQLSALGMSLHMRRHPVSGLEAVRRAARARRGGG